MPFNTAVQNTNPLLPGLLKSERLATLVKWNVLFCNFLIRYQRQSIWGHEEVREIDEDGEERLVERPIVGEAMLRAREEARKSLDMCLRFLKEHPNLEFDIHHPEDERGRVMTKVDFMAEFSVWKESSGFGRAPWIFKLDNISSAFAEMGLKYETSYLHDDGQSAPKEAIVGMCLRGGD